MIETWRALLCDLRENAEIARLLKPSKDSVSMSAQLLIINPNTNSSVSSTLQAIAARYSGEQCAVRIQTARLGMSYIIDEVSFAIAGHALLDAFAFDQSLPGLAKPDAVLIGCFGDPGLLALRQLCDAPVLGLAQASMQAAHARGRFAAITGGQAWVPMLARLVAQLALDDKLAGIYAVDKTGAQLAADPAGAVRELTQLCESALKLDSGLQTILLGGAALGGLAQSIEALLEDRGVRGVKVLDSVATSAQIAIGQAIAFAGSRTNSVPNQAPAKNSAPMQVVGLSPQLQTLLSPS